MRKFLIAIGSIICFHSFGQTAVKGTFSGGILLPIGESAEAYTFGVELAGGATVQKDRVTLGLDLAGEYFQNNPPSSSISDRLILFGQQMLTRIH